MKKRKKIKVRYRSTGGQCGHVDEETRKKRDDCVKGTSAVIPHINRITVVVL